MNRTNYLLLLLLFIASCQTIKPDVKHLEKNGTLLLSMERTPCYGRCPVYTINMYQNGLLVYNAQKFTDTTGRFYTVLSKQKMEELKNRFTTVGFFSMANTYPDKVKTPTDLPSCILFYNNGTQQKTITDKRWQTPETLTTLEKTVDSLVDFKILNKIY